MPSCLIGMKACVSTHHLSRKLNSLGHDARLTPAKYVRPLSLIHISPYAYQKAFSLPLAHRITSRSKWLPLNSIILLFRWNRFQRSYPSQPPRKVCDMCGRPLRRKKNLLDGYGA